MKNISKKIKLITLLLTLLIFTETVFFINNSDGNKKGNIVIGVLTFPLLYFQGCTTMKKNTNNEQNDANINNNINEEELKKKLSPLQYNVTRQCGTEPAFNNEYWNNKKPGLYVDIITGEPLFISTKKFDSGTGWPSFTEPINENSIIKNVDRSHGMDRVEVKAKKSNSHLGHVFDDGPGPNGLRYCINSASLKFIPIEKLKEAGYGEYLHLFETSSNQDNSTVKKEIAIFGAGCFWGVEEVFRKIPGVIKTTVGYSGGNNANPTYEDVCTGRTGHAEVIKIEFNNEQVSYEKLLEIFFKSHDPTTLNRQGPDVGTQYRSVIFFFSSKQEEAAKKAIEKLKNSGRYSRQIVTAVERAGAFYPAEEYHQKYYQKRGGGSCYR